VIVRHSLLLYFLFAEDGTGFVGESLQRRRSFSLEVTVINHNSNCRSGKLLSALGVPGTLSTDC